MNIYLYIHMICVHVCVHKLIASMSLPPTLGKTQP